MAEAFATDAQRTLMQALLDQGMSLQGADQQAQSMTLGLSQNPQGQVGYAGPVAGYAGPLRESDVPDVRAGADIPVYAGGELSRGTLEARREAGGPFRGLIPDAQAQQLMQGLHAGRASLGEGGTNTMVKALLESMGFGSAGSTKHREMLERQFLKEDLSKWYDKNTGEQASMHTDKITDYGDLRGSYMKLNAEQLKNKDALATANDVVQRYMGVAKLVELPPTPGYVNTARGWTDLKTRRLRGDPAVAELDALNAQITGLARAFGGDSRVSDKEMALLKKSVIEDGDNMESVAGKMRQLQGFLDTKTKSVGLPWLKKQAGSPQGAPQAAPAAAAGQAPQSAIDYLKANPSVKDQFKQKYGYLPEGF